MEIETKRGHADAAEVHVDVRALGELGDVRRPARKDVLPAPRYGPTHPADMIEDDRGVGKGFSH